MSESNYENLMCLGSEIADAIMKAAVIQAAAALMANGWNFEDAVKMANDFRKEVK
jgi:fatty acid-binding protein DegV